MKSSHHTHRIYEINWYWTHPSAYKVRGRQKRRRCIHLLLCQYFMPSYVAHVLFMNYWCTQCTAQLSCCESAQRYSFHYSMNESQCMGTRRTLHSRSHSGFRLYTYQHATQRCNSQYDNLTITLIHFGIKLRIRNIMDNIFHSTRKW